MTHVFPTGSRAGLPADASLGQADRRHGEPSLPHVRRLAAARRAVARGSRSPSPRHVPPPRMVTAVGRRARSSCWRTCWATARSCGVSRIRYASVDEANLQAVTEAAQHFGITAVRDDYAAARVHDPAAAGAVSRWHAAGATRSRLGSTSWVSSACVTREVRPAAGLQPAQGADHRSSCGTCGPRTVRCTVNSTGRGGRVYYASTSRRLLDDISRLLLRFGITARLQGVPVERATAPVHARHLAAATTSCASCARSASTGSASERLRCAARDRPSDGRATPTSTQCRARCGPSAARSWSSRA